MRFTYKIFLLFSMVFFSGSISAQEYFRMSADFTTKVKPATGKAMLTKGEVYYDKYSKELIYDINFPDKERWIVQDSKIFKLKNDSISHTDEIPSMNEFTVFHLALNSNLTHFGLDDAKFAISNIEKKGDMVVSYWNIPPQVENMIETIAVAKKQNRLFSVVIAGQNNKILGKQFFRDYISIDGFEFPGTIIQIYFDENDQQNYQVMEFKNIKLNDIENEKNYHYELEN